MTFYSDDKRHLVCVPYSVENLHRMAETLNIKRCWFHNSRSGPHYDIPKRRIAEIQGETVVVPTKTILAIIYGLWHGEGENAEP